MDLKTRTEQGVVVIEVSGRLDALTATDFEKYCTDAIKKDLGKMVVDLSGLEYISSAGLRSLLTLAKQLKVSGASLALCNLSGIVKEVMTVSGFNQFFPVFNDLQSAIKGDI